MILEHWNKVKPSESHFIDHHYDLLTFKQKEDILKNVSRFFFVHTAKVSGAQCCLGPIQQLKYSSKDLLSCLTEERKGLKGHENK